MKKRSKILIIIFAILLVVFGSFITTDILRAKNNEKPIFAIHIDSYEDGGSKKYVGLFYNVYAIHSIQINKEWLNEDGTLKDEYKGQEFVEYTKVTSWFTSISDVKKKHNRD
jgi:hypothetical protein